jgi:hypothetical protein
MFVQKHDAAKATADTILNSRRLRTEMFPGALFGEPAWDILLELFVADALGERRTGHEISERTKVSPWVLARWVLHLNSEGIIVGGATGDLSEVLTLSPEALNGIAQVLTRASFSRQTDA